MPPDKLENIGAPAIAPQAAPNDVELAFEEFLRARRYHREGLTARQQLWTAFDAGARFAIAKLTVR